MQNLALTVGTGGQPCAVVASEVRTVRRVDHPSQTAVSSKVFSRSPARSRQIVYLDTLARDIGEAMALIRRAGHLPPQQAGSYFRLADVGEALALIDEAGLVPAAHPDWYLRLQEFAGMA